MTATSGAALSEMHRRAKLAVLYDEIYEHYSARDAKLVRRRLVLEALQSRVMLIGQALGRDTQRLSGIPYYPPPAETSTLSRGGRELDKFLAGFGYTIQLGGAGQYTYHTDLAHYFPERKAGGTGDRPPTAEEIALNWPWLEREIQLLQPVVVVTLGLEASRYFLQRYTGRRIQRLTDVAGTPESCHVLGRQVEMIAVHHPSGAFQHPTSKEVYRRAVEHVRRSLALIR